VHASHHGAVDWSMYSIDVIIFIKRLSTIVRSVFVMSFAVLPAGGARLLESATAVICLR